MTKVIIDGHIFDYSEKAPFVAAGLSVAGAIEYDQDSDRLKCHACGAWFSSVGTHCRVHGFSAAAYKLEFGLTLRTSLESLSIRTRKSQFAATPEHVDSLRKMLKDNPRRTPRGAQRQNMGKRNLRGRCQAQTLYKIARLSAELDRNPTYTEMRANGLDPAAIVRDFGKRPMKEIFAMAGVASTLDSFLTPMKIEHGAKS